MNFSRPRLVEKQDSSSRTRPPAYHPSSPSPTRPQYPDSQRYFDQYSPERQQRRPPPSFQAHSFETSVQPPRHTGRNTSFARALRDPPSSNNAQYNLASPDPGHPPPPPPHQPTYSSQPYHSQYTASGEPRQRASRNRTSLTKSPDYTSSVHSVTPGLDNLGDTAAGGGIAGIALGVAQANERQSGVQALQAMQEAQRRLGTRPDSMSSSREDNPYVPEPPSSYVARNMGTQRPSGARGAVGGDSYDNRSATLNPAALEQPVDPFGSQASLSSIPRDTFAGGVGPSGRVTGRPPSGTWIEAPYQRRDDFWDSHIDPHEIEDDGRDDVLHGPARTGRRSMYPGVAGRSRASLAAAPVAAATGAGLGAAVSGFVPGRDASGKYGPVSQDTGYNGGLNHDPNEKDWDLDQAAKRKKRLWWIIGIGALIILAIIGAVIGGVLGSRAHSMGNSNGASSSNGDSDDGTDLTADSPSIKALLNDNRLHRVFPGIAYTPLNAQYPACLSNMPIQNNVTKDVAILSQLTDTIRLYGTDCNQTEMVIEAFKRLKLTDMKVWLAVWLDGNSTTNDRGIDAMHDIIKSYGGDPFKGVILGNEVLYRKDLTQQQVLEIVSETRSNFSAQNVNLPIAIADLGDNWTADMVQYVDVVMSNVHPFFGGVPVEQGAGWAWEFWTGKDVALTKNNATKQNIISEIGWPSGGGNDCGVGGKCTSSTQGAVASIDNMNTFMEDFVCQSITNKTDYFWFEAFDEPWKAIFNTDDEKWETQWGLFDQYRNFKNGLKVPDCGGQKPSYR